MSFGENMKCEQIKIGKTKRKGKNVSILKGKRKVKA
jgi:hypothetical protein